MLKENEWVVWRYKNNKSYTKGFVKEINGKVLLIDGSRFGIGTGLWLNIDEIEIEILKKID